MQYSVKWDMMLYNVVEIFWCFWGMCCSCWCEDWGGCSTSIWNIRKLLPDCM